MRDDVTAEIDKRIVKLYRGDGEALPVVYSNDYAESGEAVLGRCADLGCPPFHLVTVSKLGWDRNLSPWTSAPVVSKNDHFDGNAPEYLKWYLGNVVPFAEETLEL